MAVETRSTPLAPAVRGFEMFECIGEGGMGAVYRARQAGLNRLAAVKLLHADRRDPRELIRFLAEAEAAAAVRHPNIVPVYEYGEHDGRPFMAMEYLPGGTLADRLLQGPLTPTATASLFIKLARGAQAAHDQGIVHRDLKPANVLFGADGEPKIADFGLAKRGMGDMTRTFAVMGTPAYMAPEQARGEAKFVGPTADVWSLGVMLYECLTGRRPFDAADPVALASRICAVEPESPRRQAPHLPRDLELICLKCLEKVPNQRYESAAALAEDLTRFAAHRPVKARPIGTLKRLERWSRRNPGIATLLGILIMLIVGGGIAAALAAARFKDQAEDAQRLTNETLLAKREGDRKLFAAYLSDADATRRSGQAGQRFDALAKIRQAMALRDRIDLTEADRLQARNIAAAALCLPDLAPGPEFPLKAPPADLPEKFRELVAARACALPAGRTWTDICSPDNRYTILRSASSVVLADNPVELWCLDDTARRIITEPLAFHESACGFSPDSAKVALATRDGTVRIYATADGRKLAEFASGPGFMWRLVWHPDSAKLAVLCGEALRIWDTAAAPPRVWASLPGSIGDGGAAFHPAGDRIAVSTHDTRIRVYRLPEMKLLTAWSAFKTGGQRLDFTPDGAEILGADWNSILRMWDAATGRELARITNHMSEFRFTLGMVGLNVTGEQGYITRRAAGREMQILNRRHGDELEPANGHFALHPGGRLLAMATPHGLAFVDLQTQHTVATAPSAVSRENFYFDRGGTLWTSAIGADNRIGVFRWPVAIEAGVWTIGPPRFVIDHGPTGVGFTVSENGSVAVPNRVASPAAAHPPTYEPVDCEPQLDVRHATISPDGAWMATSTFHQYGDEVRMKVSDTRTGRCRATLSLSQAGSESGFSPDGRWLYTSGGEGVRYRRWDLARLAANGEVAWEPDLTRHYGTTSPDGRYLVLALRHGSFAVVDGSDGRELLRLPLADPAGVGQLHWSTDGKTLLVLGIDDKNLYAYDLPLIRRGLRDLGLDWDDAAVPESDRNGPELRVTIVGAEQFEPFVRDGIARLRAFTTAYVCRPRDAEGFVARGDARAHYGWHDAAADDYRKAIAKNAASTAAWRGLGRDFFRCGAWSDAIAAFDRALDLDPANVDSLVRRGWCRYERSEYAPAATDWSVAAKEMPKSDRQIAMGMMVAEALTKAGRVADATAMRERTKGQDLAQAANNWAWRLLTPQPAERMPGLALRLAEISNTLLPNDSMKLNTLAFAFYRNARYTEAIEVLERSLRAGDGKYIGWDHAILAMAHAGLRQPAEARKHRKLAEAALTAGSALTAKEREELQMLIAEAATP